MDWLKKLFDKTVRFFMLWKALIVMILCPPIPLTLMAMFFYGMGATGADVIKEQQTHLHGTCAIPAKKPCPVGLRGDRWKPGM